jgi:hypothetical protein
VPIDPHERELWAAERRGAVELLASLANWDAALCGVPRSRSRPSRRTVARRDLLLDAAEVPRLKTQALLCRAWS